MGAVEVIRAHNTLSSRRQYRHDNVLRVAAYCRVSTDTEDQINSYGKFEDTAEVIGECICDRNHVEKQSQ